jgi:hypothetical protein
MNKNTLVKVARLHLVDRGSYTILPWGVVTFEFVLWLLLISAAGGAGGRPVPVPGAVAGIYLVFGIVGILSMTRSLPFAFALGVSRRSYYAGTVLLAVSLSVVYGLALAVLAVAERATGGWGLRLEFFRIDYILAGPWYLTWLTSSVLLALIFAYGMWCGLLYRRWNLLGLLAFFAAQAVAGLIFLIAAGRADAWTAIGSFFTNHTAAGLTGLLAALAVVLLAGGYATMRRVTV